MEKITKVIFYTILTFIVIFAVIKLLFVIYCIWHIIHI